MNYEVNNKTVKNFFSCFIMLTIAILVICLTGRSLMQDFVKLSISNISVGSDIFVDIFFDDHLNILLAIFISSLIFSTCLISLRIIYLDTYIFSLPVVFLTFFFILHGIGTNILFNSNNPIDWINTNLAAICFTLASLLTAYNLPSTSHNKAIHLSRWSGLLKIDNYILVLLLFIFICLLSYYYHLTGGSPFYLALHKMANGDMSAAKQIIHAGRQSQYYDADTYVGQGYFELIRTGLFPYLALVLYMGLRNKSKFLPFLGYSAILICLCFSLASGQRWPAVFFMITFIFLFALLNKNIVSKKNVLLFVALAGILFILTFLMNRSSLQDAEGLSVFWAIGTRLFYRISLASHLPVFFAYIIFPNELPFQFGKIWTQDLLAYLPGPDDTFGVTYSAVLGQSWGSAPLTILGELYANFGMFGPIGGFILLGVFLTLLQEFYKTKITLFGYYAVDYSIMAIGFVRLLYGSTIGFISNALLPIIFFRCLFLCTRILLHK